MYTLILTIKLTTMVKVLCDGFSKRVQGRLSGRTTCLTCNIRRRNLGCLGGVGSGDTEVACVSRSKAMLFSGRTSISRVGGRDSEARFRGTRGCNTKRSSECSSALSRGAVCCTLHLGSNAMLEISNARSSILTLIRGLVFPLYKLLYLVLVLSKVVTSTVSGQVIGPVGRLSLRDPRRGQVCRRLSPLLDGVRERGQRVRGRLRLTGRRRRRFTLVARGVRRKLVIVSGCAVVLSTGSDT